MGSPSCDWNWMMTLAAGTSGSSLRCLAGGGAVMFNVQINIIAEDDFMEF